VATDVAEKSERDADAAVGDCTDVGLDDISVIGIEVLLACGSICVLANQKKK